MKVTICIGSSCHVKGSRQVVEKLRSIISQNSLDDEVLLTGSFCMGDCMNGVCVKIDDNIFSVQCENVETFFDTEIQPRLENESK